MFDKIEYKLLISGYMTKDEYKNLIKKYMEEFNIPYITAKQYISLKQKKTGKLHFFLEISKLFHKIIPFF